MPKLIDDVPSEIKPKRTPRKVASGARVARKRVSKKTNIEATGVTEVIAEQEKTTSAIKRKAPTRLKAEKEEIEKIVAENKKSSRKLYIGVALAVISFGIASFIGFTDDGQIDVSAVIAERNARVASGNINPEIDGDAPTSIVVPVQNSQSQMIDGGLERSTNPPVLESATVPNEVATSSTSTEQVGSSTENMGDVATSSEVQNENEDTANEPIDRLTPPSSATSSQSETE